MMISTLKTIETNKINKALKKIAPYQKEKSKDHSIYIKIVKKTRKNYFLHLNFFKKIKSYYTTPT